MKEYRRHGHNTPLTSALGGGEWSASHSGHFILHTNRKEAGWVPELVSM